MVYNLDIDETEAMNYGVNRSDVTAQIQMMLHGVPVATFPKENSMDYTVRVWLPQNQIDDFSTILNTLIVTPKGKIPLSKIAKHHYKKWTKLYLALDWLVSLEALENHPMNLLFSATITPLILNFLF